MAGRGRGQIVCYNCNQARNLARDCRNPTTTYGYCHAVDHVIEQCPQLIAKIQENNSGPTQNIQLIFVEQRPTTAINVATRSGATTHIQNAQKHPAEACVCTASEKVPALDTVRNQTPVKEAQYGIVDPSTTVVPAHQPQ